MDPINEDDLEWTEYDRGESRFRRKQLSEAADADGLGCSLYELPPGERSWPYHYHTGNDEAVFVLDGEGVLRCEDGETSLEAGDFVAFPTAEEGAHQIVNDGDTPLRYLMVSTMNEPDITVYPEMDKIGVYAGSPPGGRDERTVSGYYRTDDDVDYWEE
ncbi:cupin domain-containing protein [Natrialba sp. INN-245]|uniref:cupin domain-containing protein n=1 Tax=Natrialba sp. INN-245 TaxID=2690967 RepID=UPI00131062BC|nr:cupin domain-containing protein [Natrialba sp. INN-245]MWV40478.1 cupin domain-containing protein [Natrialba sp. INN-245]